MTTKNNEKTIVINNGNVDNVVFDGITVKKTATVTNKKTGENVTVHYTFDLTGETLQRIIEPYVQNRVIAFAPRVRKQVGHFQRKPNVLVKTAETFTGKKPKRHPKETTLDYAKRCVAEGMSKEEVINMLQNEL